MKNIVVLYHADCSDGVSAAWAAWKKFKSKASYIPVANQAEPPAGLIGKEIYTVDYVFPKEITKKLIKNNKRVTAIDHHISNEDIVSITDKPLFSLNHSGASLAWKYFHPKIKIPTYIKYIEDVDLWRLKLPQAQEFVAARPLLPKEIKDIDKFAKKFENIKFRNKYFGLGKLYMEYRKDLMNNILNNKELVSFHGKRAIAVNSPVFIDELATIMYKKESVAIIWHDKKNSRKVSLRSNGAVDVSKLAAKYGGGGHKRASAFKLSKNAKLPWKKINSLLRDEKK